MSYLPPNRLPLAQQERLLYIDLKLRFIGEVRRQDLIHRFGIQTAAATRDLALYRSEKPENLAYVSQSKSYVRCETFAPLYDTVTAGDAFAWFAPADGESGLLDPETRLPWAHAPTEATVSVEVLATITRAINLKSLVELTYRSPLEGASRRTVAPHALADVQGLRLIRAFDRTTASFADFRLDWIGEAAPLPGDSSEEESAANDVAWHSMRTLELVPHPDNVSHPDCLTKQLGLVDGVWRMEMSAALVDHWLRRLNVDVTKNHRLRGPQHLWWLKAAEALIMPS